MPDHLRILAVICIRDNPTRDRVLRHVQSVNGRALQSLDRIVQTETLANTAEELNRWYAQSESSGAIVLSDLLVEGSEITSYAKTLFKDFGEQLYATIAVMDHPVRILDIDRIVAPKCTEVELFETFKLCADRLGYLRRPRQKQSPRSVDIRLLRQHHEFLDYFRLRHAVYMPMSYLGGLVERAPSRMEIDWFDKTSFHIGAFEKTEYGRERLIGTVRLITTEPINKYHSQMASEAARLDKVLNEIVVNGAVMWMLPVFQGHAEMIREIRDAALRGLVFGEVSRVIVHPDYRGGGLSHRLCDFAICTAADAGVEELFLECLPIHADIYRKVGFETFSELSGKVYGIDRTMIVMHLPLRPRELPTPGV